MNTSTAKDEISCLECGRSFVHAKYLAMHVLIHDIEGRTISCDDCGKRFHKINHLKLHQRSHEESRSRKRKMKEEPLDDVSNSATDEVVGSASKKRKLTGSVDDNFKCRFCSRSFTHIGYLRQHLVVHKDVRMDEGNASSSVNENHLDSHSDPVVQCDSIFQSAREVISPSPETFMTEENFLSLHGATAPVSVDIFEIVNNDWEVDIGAVVSSFRV